MNIDKISLKMNIYTIFEEIINIHGVEYETNKNN
jgi:hypothetical protein